MKNNYLIYIQSPFQLLQAFEIIKAEGLSRIKIIISLNKHESNNIQLSELTKHLGLRSNVEFIKSSNRFFRPFLMLRVLLLSMVYSRLYIPDETRLFTNFMIRLIKKNKLTLIDDGNNSIASRFGPEYNRFTIYNISQLKNNRFVHLKRWISSYEPECLYDRDIIIGQTLDGEVPNEFYIKYLEAICKKSSNIIYIPHRYEDDLVVESYKKKFGFEVQRLKMPIELIQYECKVKPRRFFGCISTAIFSLSSIYTDARIFYYKFDDCVYTNRKQLWIKVYHHVSLLENTEEIVF